MTGIGSLIPKLRFCSPSQRRLTREQRATYYYNVKTPSQRNFNNLKDSLFNLSAGLYTHMSSGTVGIAFPGDAEAFGGFAPHTDSFSGAGSFAAPPPSTPAVLASSGGAYLRSQSMGGGGNFFPSPAGNDLEDYNNEPPLLEELGVSFSHISQKVVAVLMLHKPIAPAVLRDADLAGPIVFCVLLGFCMLLVRRITWGFPPLPRWALPHPTPPPPLPVTPLLSRALSFAPTPVRQAALWLHLRVWAAR